METAKTIGRWLLFLPGALAASVIAGGVAKLFFRYTDVFGAFDPDTWLGRAMTEATSGAAIGAAFVYAGAVIAPTSQQRVCFGLAALGLVITGAGLLANVVVSNYWGVWEGVFIGLGAAAVAYSTHEGELFPIAPGEP
jgi:hypothetical protein